MKKKHAFRNWFYAAGIFVACGCIHLIFDWLQYSSTLNSAPFSIWILANAAGFGIPAAACFLIGWILWKRTKQRKDDTR